MPTPPGKTMHKIEKRAGGFTLTFGGIVNKAELDRWVEESKQALTGCTKPFGVIVDMRTMRPLPSAGRTTMIEGQRLYQHAGMQRSAVILNSPTTTLQFKRLAKESGIDLFERYIDASQDPDWKKHAEDWVDREIDPEK